MEQYKLEIKSSAEKSLKKIAKKDQVKLTKAILELVNDPIPQGVRKLTGYDDIYRIRVSNYRVIYSIQEKKLIILVLKIAHRKDVYR